LRRVTRSVWRYCFPSRATAAARLVGLVAAPAGIASSLLWSPSLLEVSPQSVVVAAGVVGVGWVLVFCARRIDHRFGSTTSGRLSLLAAVTLTGLAAAHLLGAFFGYRHGTMNGYASYALWDAARVTAALSFPVLAVWEFFRWEVVVRELKRRPRYWVSRALAIGLGPALIWLPAYLWAEVSDAFERDAYVLLAPIALVAGWTLVLLARQVDSELRGTTSSRVSWFVATWSTVLSIGRLAEDVCDFLVPRFNARGGMDMRLYRLMARTSDPGFMDTPFMAVSSLLVASAVVLLVVELALRRRSRMDPGVDQ